MSIKKIMMYVVMAVALAIGVVGCGSRTPLPENLVILPPTKNVPEESAKLAGGWIGSHTNDIAIRSITAIFTNITKDKVDFWYCYGDSRSTKYGNRRSNDSGCQYLHSDGFVNGRLSAKTEGGSGVSFWWNPDDSDTLFEEFTDSRGTSKTTFHRSSVEKLRKSLE